MEMNDRSCKEVSRRRERSLLFEQPEPLFPEWSPRRKIMLTRLVAAIILMACAAVIWSVSVYGADRQNGSFNGGSPGHGGDESTGNGYQESETSSEWTSPPPQTEERTENKEVTEESNKDETAEGDTSIESEASAEEETESEAETFKTKELDLSKTEKGENFIFNYSEKDADIRGLIDRGFVDRETVCGGAPLVMVIHTHTSEKYNSANGKPSAFDSVVSVGEMLNTRLNSLGLASIHCTVIHDGGEENAYLAARETIKTMLKIYPSIKYVIDLHRMHIEEDGYVIKTFSGSEDDSAQIRLSVSSQSGVAWQEELSLALALRGELNDGGDKICMPVLLTSSRYNSDLCEYYIMADIGSSGNTLSEARAAVIRLAASMAEVILI